MLVSNIRKARKFRMLRGTDVKERYWNIKINYNKVCALEQWFNIKSIYYLKLYFLIIK